MTKEDKELLFKDLSARWMTALKCAPSTKNSIAAYCTVDGIKRDIKGGSFIELTDRDSDGNALASTSTNEFDIVRPYLRPISSMTEEEKKEVRNIKENICSYSIFPGTFKISDKHIISLIDFYYSHYFDYRGLIEKGLALEAPDGMYNIK